MNKNELWKKILDEISVKVTPTTYSTFIAPAKIRELDEELHIAYLESKEGIYTNVLRNRYIPLLEEIFKNVTGENYRVIVKDTSEYDQREEILEPEKKSVAYDINLDFMKEKIFNPKYTFDNFVVGESNKYANAACYAVAQSPSKVYNPLFIYGKSGLGKTHLMNAIGIYLLQHHKNLKILYVSSETFTNDFIKALQDGKTREFKNKYRKADALLIDDIQFLEGKESMQEEFFHTFNALHDDNKQIIISSDRPPNKLTELDERLRSRFGWNMIASLQPPDYETRVAILMKKAENMGVEVDDDLYSIMCLISEKIKDNIRELEGAFQRIVSFSQIMNEKANLEFAKRILKDIIQNGGSSVTPEKIKTAVSRYYKIKISDLESNTRKSTIAYPRQIAMYLCRTMTDYSLPNIGNLFGNRHYSTVKHACDKIEEEIKTDEELKETIETIKAEINK